MMSHPESEVAMPPGDRPGVLCGGTVLTMDDAHTVLPEADVMATDA
jgi:5-methylthioadenosine/S-adenosylhomocysteine deaminase